MTESAGGAGDANAAFGSQATSGPFPVSSPLSDILPRLYALELGRALITLALFLILGVSLTRDSLSYPWFWSDLHLVRPYSTAELRSALTAQSEADGSAAGAYQPLTPLFNAARALVFGESVLAQRLFQLLLVAAYLTLLGRIAQHLGMPAWQTLMAGALALVSKNNWYNLVWISDGVHAFAGVLAALGGLSLLSYLDRPRRWKLLPAGLLPVVALFAREDSLVFIPIVLLLGVAYIALRAGWRPPGRARLSGESWRGLLAMLVVALLLFLGAALFFLMRQAFVPNAAPEIRLEGWSEEIRWLLFPMGQVSEPFTGLWLALLVFIGVLGLTVINRRSRDLALFWLLCAILATAFGAVTPRPDLLLAGIGFISLALAVLLGGMIQRSRLMAVAAGLILVFVFFLSIEQNLIAQQAMNPLSLEGIRFTKEFVYGRFGVASVPPARRSQIEQQWAQWGIKSEQDFERVYPLLYEDARKNNRYSPEEGKPFIPRIQVLSP